MKKVSFLIINLWVLLFLVTNCKQITETISLPSNDKVILKLQQDPRFSQKWPPAMPLFIRIWKNETKIIKKVRYLYLEKPNLSYQELIRILATRFESDINYLNKKYPEYGEPFPELSLRLYFMALQQMVSENKSR